MVKALARATPVLYVVAGQSNAVAPAGGATTFAFKTFDPLGIKYRIRATGGTPWISVTSSVLDLMELASTPDDVDDYATQALETRLILCGGSSDVWENDLGETVYENMVTYAEARRDAGYAKVIAMTIPPNSVNAGLQENFRQDANAAIIGDAAGAWNAVANLTTSVFLEDWEQSTYDGIHWHEEATDEVAALLTAVLPP